MKKMKKIMLLVSLALVLGLVMGCPQPNDSGNGGGGGGSNGGGEDTPTMVKATLNETVITITPSSDADATTFKAALQAVVNDDNRDTITKITIVPPAGGAKIIPEKEINVLFTDNDGNSNYVDYTALESILGLENLDTSNVTKMTGMFYNCRRLTNLNLSTWNTSKVETMGEMLSGCSALAELNLSGWDTSNVTESGSFNRARLISVTVSNTLTENIANQIKPRHGDVDNGGEAGYANPGKWVKDGMEYDAIPVVDGKAVAGTYTAKLAE